IGFNVRPEAKASELARNDGVDVKTYTVIYDLINDIHSALEGMLKPVIREEVVGQGEIKSVFSSSKAGRIAGGILNEGKLEKTHQIRLYRDNVLIHSGTLASLRRFKDDVDQIQAGQEFGCMVNNFSDIKEGDFIEAVVKTEITPTLARGGRSTG
ncbi:MAG: translation initiation factor IF-2, partial [Deltaproteobacteria bacterium]|nr:translation initiation factor IF-2 [Deltaproteobacteria bacterium]